MIIPDFKKILFPLLLNVLLWNCSAGKKEQSDDQFRIPRRNIQVDGKTADWNSLTAFKVDNQSHIWLGQDLREGIWNGPSDLSFSWKTAWNNGKLFFLVEVTDDTISSFNQEYAWLNDCLEIYVDPLGSGGARIAGIGAENTLEDRLGKEMRGYEMQFLPTLAPKVFIDDSKSIYYTHNDQSDYFLMHWQGEVVGRKTENGYLFEIGFAVPGVHFQSGHQLSMDVAVCDDDGNGRKSLLIASRFKGEFWLTMDNFKKGFLE